MKIKENLKNGFQKKKNKYISLLTKSMLIRHKPTKLEYTIEKISFINGDPSIIAYRYYSKEKSNKKVYIEIPLKDFNEYESV